VIQESDEDRDQQGTRPVCTYRIWKVGRKVVWALADI